MLVMTIRVLGVWWTTSTKISYPTSWEEIVWLVFKLYFDIEMLTQNFHGSIADAFMYKRRVLYVEPQMCGCVVYYL